MKIKSLLLFFIALVFISANVYAGIIVTPARSEIVIENGQTYKGAYTVENGFDSAIDVSVSVETWNNSPENKDVDVKDWLDISAKSVRLAAGESAEIGYTVNSGNLKGSLSAMISFLHGSPGLQGISLMTSVPVYITIEGTQRIEFDIFAMKVEKARATPNYNITYEVNNTGNVPVRVKGILKIMKGKKIVASQAIGEQSPTYAGQTRFFYEVLQPLPKGKYILNISLNALNKTAEKNIQIRVNKYGDISY
jgi:hypothetical protein